MYITSLSIKNFRNIDNLLLKFDKKTNAIIGDNAQGKTNIIEAIYTAINAKSFRTKNDIELIKTEQESCKIRLNFIKNQREQQIDMMISRDNKKKIAINGVALNKTFELIGYLNIVLFSPEDLKLVKGSPTERRRFLNREISHIDKKYLNYLINYNRVLNQKNKFLKFNSEKVEEISLDIWDEQLAKYGKYIIKKRFNYIKNISKKASQIHRQISENKEELILKYQSDLYDENDAIIEKKTIEKLKSARVKDMRYGYTTVGPHREDFELFINQKNLKKYGSQGQQRSALLAVKLAEIEIINHVIGEYPILLLDDVMSELDNNRQMILLKEIKRTQTLLTTTDLNGLKAKDIAPYWRHFIVDGSVKSSQEVLSAE